MAYKFLVDNKDSSAPPPNKEYVLVVEGEDDGVFLEHVLTLRGSDQEKIEVQYVKGISNVPGYLSALAKSPPFTSGKIKNVALIVDADNNFEAAQNTVASWFSEAGLPSAASGCVETDGNMSSGLYLFPNSQETGELEDLIISCLVEDLRFSSAVELIDKFEDSKSPFKKKSKRVIQVALAVSNTDLCAGAGRGIRNGAFNIQLENLSSLNTFLDRFLS